MKPDGRQARELAIVGESLHRHGFRCSRCGSCCRDDGDESWAVFVSPQEIHRIEAATGILRDRFTRPYRESVLLGNNTTVTFGWEIVSREGHCFFLGDEGCRIYPFRPWICRAYPFGRDDPVTVCEQCPGVMGDGSMGRDPRSAVREKPFRKMPLTGFGASLMQAACLIRRRREETAEEAAVRKTLNMISLPEESSVVVDSTGVTRIYG